MNKTFKIGDEEFPVIPPKGRKGRKATNFLMAFLSGGSTGEDIFKLLDDEHFERHLPILLNLDPGFLEENGTTFEIMTATFAVIEAMNEGFEMPEVDAALKNSEDIQAEEEEQTL